MLLALRAVVPLAALRAGLAQQAQLPPWPATYNLSRSTFLMPCNYSGFFDPSAAAAYGIVCVQCRLRGDFTP
eukprot:COSAG03_NODE_1657_length_3709_cov_5.853740_4_plen_72_part_00